MAHQIFGDRFYSRDERKPVWHGLGKRFDADAVITAQEAFQTAGLMYKFITQPLFFTDPQTGNPVQTEQKIVLREPTSDDPQYRVVSNAVGNDYGLLQNEQIARTLDDSGITRQWPVETVGALRKGERMFVTLAAPKYDIKGDEMERYFLVSDGKGGDYGLNIAIVNIRVVCQNTLTMALGSALTHIKFNHTVGVQRDLEIYSQIITQMEDGQAHIARVFEQLSDTRVNDDDAKKIIRAAFPEPVMPKKAQIFERYMEKLGVTNVDPRIEAEWGKKVHDHDILRERRAALRVATTQCYERINDEHPRIARTAWAVVNAVAEVEDNRVEGKTGNTGALFMSRLYGPRREEYDRAFSVAAELAGVN